jgi:hypothetical protein
MCCIYYQCHNITVNSTTILVLELFLFVLLNISKFSSVLKIKPKDVSAVASLTCNFSVH